jgi:hypothetical protein
MGQGSVERRRGRRVNVEAPLQIRRLGTRDPKSLKEELTKNVSLAGVYFETDEGHDYSLDDVITASVSVPEAKRREFPFTRIAGRSRVVRVRELSQQTAERKRIGIALEFGDDVTALTATPPRG